MCVELHCCAKACYLEKTPKVKNSDSPAEGNTGAEKPPALIKTLPQELSSCLDVVSCGRSEKKATIRAERGMQHQQREAVLPHTGAYPCVAEFTEHRPRGGVSFFWPMEHLYPVFQHLEAESTVPNISVRLMWIGLRGIKKSCLVSSLKENFQVFRITELSTLGGVMI